VGIQQRNGKLVGEQKLQLIILVVTTVLLRMDKLEKNKGSLLAISARKLLTSRAPLPVISTNIQVSVRTNATLATRPLNINTT
jgi:hypothetical protein